MQLLITSFILIYFLFIISNGLTTYTYALEGLCMWFEKLIPSLFIPMIIIKILYMRNVFSFFHPKWILKLLNINKEALNIILSCMLLGFPTSSLLIDQAYHEHLLSKEGATRLLYICSFAAPGFVIVTCGGLFFHSIHIGIILFCAQIIAGLILLLCTRKQPIHAVSTVKKSQPFTKQLAISIKESGITLYMIGGYLLIFLSFTNTISNYLPSFLILPIKVVMEFSSGSFQINSLSIPLLSKSIFLTLLLSFGGFCVHMQIFSMVEYIPLSYIKFLYYRILQGIFASISFYILYALFL